MTQNFIRWGAFLAIACAFAAGLLSSRADMTDTTTSPHPVHPTVIETARGSLNVESIDSRPGRIELPYRYYHRPGRSRPTVFFLAGGPGMSNLKFNPPSQWLSDFDVVLLEYRGVGSSSIKLHSSHFAHGLMKLKGTLSIAATEAMRADFAAGFADLRAQGIDFEDFSIDALADDVERLRVKLDLPAVYLVAHSFGTRVALNYQTRYRSSVAASLLFSMNMPGGFIWQPDETQSVLQRYQAHLARTNAESSAALARAISAPRPRPASFGPFAINDAKALFVAFFLSFNSSTRDHAYKALTTANDGSTWRWLLLDQAYDWFVRFGFNWADFFLKAYTADCDRAAIERADALGQFASFQSPSSVLFAGVDGFEAAGGSCQPARWTPDLRHTVAINGEFDTTTPLERRPAELADDRYIVIPGSGHADVLFENNGRSAKWMREYFLKPQP